MQQPAESILTTAMLCKLGASYNNVEITLYINLKVNQKKQKTLTAIIISRLLISGEYLSNKINHEIIKTSRSIRINRKKSNLYGSLHSFQNN